MQELENNSKSELLDKQIEFERAKAAKKNPEPKHDIKGPKLSPFKKERMTWMHICIDLKGLLKV